MSATVKDVMTEIRREVTERVILHSFLTDPALSDITVQDGIVTLPGGPESSEMGQQLAGAVRRLDGVEAVKNLLSYPR
jgi:osmotically-inducible protein OsmY